MGFGRKFLSAIGTNNSYEGKTVSISVLSPNKVHHGFSSTSSIPMMKQIYASPPQANQTASHSAPGSFQAGAFFGAIFGFFFAEYFGRKPVIIGSSAVFTIGSGLQLVGRIDELYAGRVLTGLGSILHHDSRLHAECSPALVRGRLVGCFAIMLQVALVFGFWVNYGMIPAGLLLICLSWIIESPRWLASKNRIVQAQKNLAWVRNLPFDHPYVVNELTEIQAAVNQELEMSGGRRTLSHIIVFTGTSVGLLATGVYGLVKMCTTTVFMIWIVDRYGRRGPLLVGAIGAAVAMFYLAIYSQLSQSFDQVPPSDSGSRTVVAMIYVYAIFYGFSWNSIPWIFASEILPTRVRTIGMMSCTIVALAFAYLFVPETEGVPLEDMGILFEADVSVFATKTLKNYLEFRQAESRVAAEAQ
ncbi:general substrate transporter [Aspergillus eucalypticola CBS 122712]|uniref:General substrate transporter n=1 Tax=Aspergillus eucalypticola (strain CBS 122712 / IBT 29274) TaxID=1448314 RepID=A0A317V7F9_ASPEC|nr:general substrate transporter [Aspergillus eucalypticola CBS 122712]PWY69965.1 general substrate transporter [Aspergillus eucalypticola CBS 122712]